MNEAGEILKFVFDGVAVRTVMFDGNPWFVAADVCRVLGVGNPRQAVARLDPDQVNTVILNDGTAGNPRVNGVSESGLYELVFRSDKSNARKFTKWVTSEVLPAIRRDGLYIRKPLSASKARIAAEALLVASHEKALAAGGAGLEERQLFHGLARQVLAEYPEWVVAAIGQWLHDCIYHTMARREKRAMQSYDPAQPELPNLFSVMRDGRERAVARAILTQAEKLAIIARAYRMRAGFQKFSDRTRRRDLALVREHNQFHSSESITADMLALRAPDLLH